MVKPKVIFLRESYCHSTVPKFPLKNKLSKCISDINRNRIKDLRVQLCSETFLFPIQSSVLYFSSTLFAVLTATHIQEGCRGRMQLSQAPWEVLKFNTLAFRLKIVSSNLWETDIMIRRGFFLVVKVKANFRSQIHRNVMTVIFNCAVPPRSFHVGSALAVRPNTGLRSAFEGLRTRCSQWFAEASRKHSWWNDLHRGKLLLVAQIHFIFPLLQLL